jgi:hypothetical protein
MQQLQALGAELVRHECDAREIASRPVHARHQAESHRIATDGEDDRNGTARVLGGARRGDVSGGRHGDGAHRDELVGECRQGAVVGVRPSLLDADVAAVDEPGLCQPLPEGVGIEAVGDP